MTPEFYVLLIIIGVVIYAFISLVIAVNWHDKNPDIIACTTVGFFWPFMVLAYATKATFRFIEEEINF